MRYLTNYINIKLDYNVYVILIKLIFKYLLVETLINKKKKKQTSNFGAIF